MTSSYKDIGEEPVPSPEVRNHEAEAAVPVVLDSWLSSIREKLRKDENLANAVYRGIPKSPFALWVYDEAYGMLLQNPEFGHTLTTNQEKWGLKTPSTTVSTYSKQWLSRLSFLKRDLEKSIGENSMDIETLENTIGRTCPDDRWPKPIYLLTLSQVRNENWVKSLIEKAKSNPTIAS